MSNDNSNGRYGLRDVETETSEYNALQFLVLQILNGRNTATLVQVKAVSADGTVDVRPMVNQLDGQGVAVPHGIVHGLPYFRLQGGANAVIIDPKVGDIGIAVFADRDISSVKSTKAVANPGSMRRADMADGLYLGGFLNGVPQQYVQFSDDGIKLLSPTKIRLEAPVIEIAAGTSVTVTTPQFIVNGASTFNGTIDATGTIAAPEVLGGGKSLSTHIHNKVKPGTISEVSGGPV